MLGKFLEAKDRDKEHFKIKTKREIQISVNLLVNEEMVNQMDKVS
jgi:hypothetical protein